MCISGHIRFFFHNFKTTSVDIGIEKKKLFNEPHDIFYINLFFIKINFVTFVVNTLFEHQSLGCLSSPSHNNIHLDWISCSGLCMHTSLSENGDNGGFNEPCFHVQLRMAGEATTSGNLLLLGCGHRCSERRSLWDWGNAASLHAWTQHEQCTCMCLYMCVMFLSQPQS